MCISKEPFQQLPQPLTAFRATPTGRAAIGSHVAYHALTARGKGCYASEDHSSDFGAAICEGSWVLVVHRAYIYGL